MGNDNSSGSRPVCLLDDQNSNRCTLDNPVVSYLKHLDDEQYVSFESSHQGFDTDRFRKIGDQLVSKIVLRESVSNAKCFQVRLKADEQDDESQIQATMATNWLCEDDLENYWRNNCLVLYPSITTCMDEMAILKHTGDAQNLQLALQRQLTKEEGVESEPLSFFYNFDYLAQLFVGHCIKVDGQEYCPEESVDVSTIDEEELERQRCSLFDDVIVCQHDLREALQGGQCLMAGLTYFCEDDIPKLLSEKCLDFQYLASGEIMEHRVCGRQLVDFLYGQGINVPLGDSLSEWQEVRVVTGNDIEMLSAQCLLLDGYQVCWENEPVARPFEFIDHRCSVDEDSQRVFCLGPRSQ